MEFGEIRDVPLREVWGHEAQQFTPWLAANMERLSEAIGVPMEPEGTEVAVEQFSADIVARNSANGSRVLIENQLESSDHRHLGQDPHLSRGSGGADRNLDRAGLRRVAPVGRPLAE